MYYCTIPLLGVVAVVKPGSARQATSGRRPPSALVLPCFSFFFSSSSSEPARTVAASLVTSWMVLSGIGIWNEI